MIEDAENKVVNQFDVHMNERGILSILQSAQIITVPDFEPLFADYTESQPQEDEFANPAGKELL